MAYNIPLSSLTPSDGNVLYGTGYILKVGGPGNITVSSTLFENGGSVGIGTVSPVHTLGITGNAFISNSAWAGNISITNTTISTSTTTGVVVVRGGAGIAGNVYVGGNINVSNTTQSTSALTGALIVRGGTGITGNAFVSNAVWAGNISITNTTISTSTATGVLVVAGGAGIAGNLFLGGNVVLVGASNAITTQTGSNANLVIDPDGTGDVVFPQNTEVFVQSTVSSNASAYGALVVTGGVGVGGNIYSSGNVVISGNLRVGTTTAPGSNTAVILANSPAGGGIELVSNNSGGGNIAGLGGGGLSFSTFTGAIGSESYTQRLLIDVNGNLSSTGTTATLGFKEDVGGNLRVAGNIVATGEITAYFSDQRLKTNITPITNAVNLVMSINGVYYNPNEIAERLAGEDQSTRKVGLLAQEVQRIMPQVVRSAPFDIGDHGASLSGQNYLTLQYERLIPLLVEAVKEQQRQIDELRQMIKA